MKHFQKICLIFLSLAAGACARTKVQESAPQSKVQVEGHTRFVNPFIGTAPLLDPAVIGYTPPKDWRVWAGLVYPGSALPNAMVQLSPITEFGSGAGYEYEDSTIYAFTHTNKGHWNLCNIPVLPVMGKTEGEKEFSSSFSHTQEQAAPGFYAVMLQDYGVQANLTSTLRGGFHQYVYPANKQRSIVFKLSKANSRVHGWHLEQASATAVQGYQDMGGEHVYFYASLSQGIAKLEQRNEGHKDGLAILHLQDGGSATVEMKIGLSFVSAENARQNLEAELAGKSFGAVRAEANEAWEQLLATIDVKGGTDKQKQLFYTSLYRAFLWPALRSDVNGEFRSEAGETVKANFRYYTIPSLWDTYRNKLVLLGLVSPEVTADVIQSLKVRGDHRGFIPTFFHGDHAAAFIAGAYLRGISGFDVEGAYRLLLRNANEEGGTRPFIKEYIEKGYISEPDVANPHVETKAKAGVSKTLEYAYDDYALAQLAKALGDTANYKSLMQRSQNFRNVFDSGSNFMRGRLADGSCVKDFNPQYPYYEYMYREANAWQLSFYAPHNMPALVALYGGKKAFEAKLDSLFSVPWNPAHIARNVSGFIGQYCHGNQPDHEAPFAYYFVDKPQKSQRVIDAILDNFYGIGEKGLALSGMDDAGEMSSWYVFSALGLYPFSPADQEYLVTVPVFDEVRWKLPHGRELKIAKQGGSRHLQAVAVNGEQIEGYTVPHALFSSGGEIRTITE